MPIKIKGETCYYAGEPVDRHDIGTRHPNIIPKAEYDEIVAERAKDRERKQVKAQVS